MTIDYRAIYTEAFYREADGIAEWEQRKLKVGDALAAVAYAHGLTFEELRQIVPFEGHGQLCADDGLDAGAQIARVLGAKKRTPRGILEIGGGRGEVSVSLAHHGYPVQSVEPSPGAASWYGQTAERFFGVRLDALPLRLLNTTMHEALAAGEIDWAAVDTVLMVESLEHILAADFAPAYAAIRDNLRERGGRFIVTNWIGHHPLDVGWHASPQVHCRLVDDALYDAWAAEAGAVFCRNGSHLALDYGVQYENS